jgi:hypothetical protein
MNFKAIVLAASLAAVSSLAQAGGSPLVGNWRALSGAPGSIAFDAKGSAVLAPDGAISMHVRYKQLSKTLLELSQNGGVAPPVVVIYTYHKGKPDVLEFEYQNGQNQKFARVAQTRPAKK